MRLLLLLLLPLLALPGCYRDDHARECSKEETADPAKCYRWGYQGGYTNGYQEGSDDAYQEAYDAGYVAAMATCTSDTGATTPTDSGTSPTQ